MKKGLAKATTALSLGVLGVMNMMTLPVSADNAVVDIGSFKPDQLDVAEDPSALITNIINLVFVVAAVLTLVYLVWGAIQWITSGGDKGKVEEARNKITAAVIGLLILAATWAIFQLILAIAFGGDSGFYIPSFIGG